MALINDLVPFTDNLKSKEVCDLNPLGPKEIKHLKMQYHLFYRTRVSDRTPFGEQGFGYYVMVRFRSFGLKSHQITQFEENRIYSLKKNAKFK